MNTTLQWIDSHAHLDYEYPFDTATYLDRAAAAGVNTVITVGANRPTWSQIRDLADAAAANPAKPQVYFSVGIHPHDATTYSDEVGAEMRSYAAHNRCVAIGEIGLDYHYDNSPRDVQQAACRAQLELALSLGKPVIIHSRDGEADLLPLLAEYAKTPGATGVIHCFSGTPKFAAECLALGFYISFSGILTFKKADEVRAAAKLVPLDKVLVETDAPYLAPMPHRGKSNESAYMVETCRALASVMGVSLEELSRATVANTRRLFGF